MDLNSPVITDAFHLLRGPEQPTGHADELALQLDVWTEHDADTACELIPALVNVIRALVIEHQVTPHGNCRTCQAIWPCPVITTIHAVIKDPDREFAALVLSRPQLCKRALRSVSFLRGRPARRGTALVPRRSRHR